MGRPRVFSDAERKERRRLVVKRYNDAKYAANPEAERARMRNRPSAKKIEINNRWRMKHPEKARELRRKQAEALKLRTLAWSDISKIKKFYANKPVGMVVDHVVPLRGKNVSGLHVSWNLQYLTPQENIRKGNRFGKEG